MRSLPLPFAVPLRRFTKGKSKGNSKSKSNGTISGKSKSTISKGKSKGTISGKSKGQSKSFDARATAIHLAAKGKSNVGQLLQAQRQAIAAKGKDRVAQLLHRDVSSCPFQYIPVPPVKCNLYRDDPVSGSAPKARALHPLPVPPAKRARRSDSPVQGLFQVQPFPAFVDCMARSTIDDPD